MIEVDPVAAGFDAGRLQLVSQWLAEQVESNRLAGCSVLVARHGVTALCDTAGLADRENQTSFDVDTLVRIYSMTKPLTTVAAMMLYEGGSFQLDDPVALYLPEFAQTPVWLGGNATLSDTETQTTPMTVRQLMTHTSGLTYGFMHNNVVDKHYRDEGIQFPGAQVSLEEMVNRLAAVPLMCQPGSQWNYSVSTDVLGRLIEVWSGQSLSIWMQEHLLQPLGMHQTGFSIDAALRDKLAALYGPGSGIELGHAAQSNNPLNGPAKPSGVVLLEAGGAEHLTKEAVLYSGGGGLVSSLKDYARFCQMMLNGGSIDGVRLLSPKTINYMRRNHLPDNQDIASMGQSAWSESGYEGIGFGLGFATILDPVKAQMITSSGEYHWGGAASTFFWVDPLEDLYVIFFTQLLPSSTYPLRRELRVRIYQSLIDCSD